MSVVPPPSPRPSGAYGGGGFYQQPQPNRKLLGIGQIASATTWTTVYTVPKGASAEVRFCSCYNTSAVTTQTVDARVTKTDSTGTESRQFARASVVPAGSVRFFEGGEVLFLGPGQLLQIYTTTAAVLDYVVSGIEWTIPTGGATA